MPSDQTFAIKSALDQRGADDIDALKIALANALAGRAVRVQTVNLHHLYLAQRSPEFLKATLSADMITADGWPIVKLAKPRELKRVTGSEFTAWLLSGETDVPGLRVALLGASERAGELFEHSAMTAGHHVVYREHGMLQEWSLAEIARDLIRSKCQVLLIAVTPPSGELVASRLAMAGIPGMIIGVGGSIDMAVGLQSRAPAFVRKMQLEWMWRMIRSPRRLTRRYLVECFPTYVTQVMAMRRAR